MEIVENICPYCGEHIFGNKKVFANHVRWCKKNPKYLEILNSTISKIKNKKLLDKEIHIKQFEVKCHKCGKLFVVSEDDRKFPSKERYYCSKLCSHMRTQTDETKRKISENVKRKCVAKIKKCKYCGKEFTGRRKFCSDECYRIYKSRNSKNQKLKIYLSYCKFNFAINQYPDEFDISLVEKFGWYKAKNRGNNLFGISRDHKFSQLEGWNKKIDPYIISHPANCELMQHSKNVSKYKKCSISIDKLIKNIDIWNHKYGVYENKINYNIFKQLGISFNIIYDKNISKDL